VTTNHPDCLGETNGPKSPAGEPGCNRELPSRTNRTVPSYPQFRREPHVLIVSSDDALAGALISILDESGFAAERVATMTDACALAECGNFQVILTEPVLTDGSWKRLANFAKRSHSEFVVVLVAKSSDLRQSVYPKQGEVFDLIDASNELPKAPEVVMRALWVEYLNGSGPVPGLLRPRGKAGR
jgi:DNA-binding NtrC family response regulator